jgi:hypothetical protein
VTLFLANGFNNITEQISAVGIGIPLAAFSIGLVLNSTTVGIGILNIIPPLVLVSYLLILIISSNSASLFDVISIGVLLNNTSVRIGIRCTATRPHLDIRTEIVLSTAKDIDSSTSYCTRDIECVFWIHCI